MSVFTSDDQQQAGNRRQKPQQTAFADNDGPPVRQQQLQPRKPTSFVFRLFFWLACVAFAVADAAVCVLFICDIEASRFLLQPLAKLAVQSIVVGVGLLFAGILWLIATGPM